jgi:hypothetical protein
MRILLWGTGALFLFMGIGGIGSSGLWSRGAQANVMNMPSEGFIFFGVLMFLLDWVLRRER